jgi:hypothetical protein
MEQRIQDVLVFAGGSVRAAAGAEFELADLEVLLELAPLNVSGFAVLGSRADRAARFDEGPVGADEVVLKYREVRLGGGQAGVPE